ncbi:MAG: aminodeoxychorismate synthase component I [Lentisphaerae bacterium]|nr:aminodeoxychorismate synthase component I [Lentisphaerota bacterium]
MRYAFSAIVQIDTDDWMIFKSPVRIMCADTVKDVLPLINEAENAVKNGQYAVIMLAYEAAPAFDSALETRPACGIPLIWVGIYDGAQRVQSLPVATGSFEARKWMSTTSQERYRDAIRRIKRYIAAGDTYQVNYTIRMIAQFSGDPYAFFCSLVKAQQSRHCAFLDIGKHVVCSASPELFLHLNGQKTISRPMKGTYARGLTYSDDIDREHTLMESEKNRAENIMIVDMVRNDLGRVAQPGSVKVAERFRVERFPTILQLTSTVEARISASFTDILKAVFPCASITGAPKVRTMSIIRELEDTPRGVYTGSIGCLLPAVGRHGTMAHFNVAIRTVTIDTTHDTAEYGVGGGIIWDSSEEGEFAECLTKAAVLTSNVPDFDLLETMLWSPDSGYFLLALHMTRLKQSAYYFGYKYDEEIVAKTLISPVASFRNKPQRIRLIMSRDGKCRVESNPIENNGQTIMKVGIALMPVNSRDPYLYHKTTHRYIYETAQKSRQDCDDVILYNEKKEVTEATRANVVIKERGKFYTPPISCGVLGGTFRRYLLDSSAIEEQVISLDRLKSADRIYLINSVRKWMTAKLAHSATNGTRQTISIDNL